MKFLRIALISGAAHQGGDMVAEQAYWQKSLEALGSELQVHVAVDARPAATEDVRELAADVHGDDPAGVEGVGADEAELVGRFGARSNVREGETVSITVDTRALHFFDPETGLGIYDGNQKGTSV